MLFKKVSVEELNELRYERISDSSEPELSTTSAFSGDKNTTQSFLVWLARVIKLSATVALAGPETINETSTESGLDSVSYAVTVLAVTTVPSEPPDKEIPKSAANSVNDVFEDVLPQADIDAGCDNQRIYLDWFAITFL